jgi:glycosyltransferase involved in cell wall biosynthesis
MKICHLTTVHSPFDIRIFHKECKTLAKAGYDVTLIAPHDKDEMIDGIKIISLPKPKNRFDRMSKLTWHAYKKAKQIDAEIYHFHDPELLLVAQLLRGRGRSLIYDMHENTPKAIRTKHWIPSLLRRLIALLYQCVERVLIYKMWVIFAETSYRKDYPYVNDYAIVLNMPLLSVLLNISEEKYPIPTVGYIGGVNLLRGCLAVIDALQILAKNGLKVHWECIGPVDEDCKSKITNALAVLGSDGIRIRGFMKPTEAWPIIARCHVGIAILEPIPNFLESYPTKMFEYMALGLPVVVSNFPLYREVVEGAKCGICVDPSNPAEIARAIKWIIEHPEEAKLMGQNGRKTVLEKYSWENESKNLLELYEKIIHLEMPLLSKII